MLHLDPMAKSHRTIRSSMALSSLMFAACSFPAPTLDTDGIPGEPPDDAPTGPGCTNVPGFVSFCGQEPAKSLILAANETKEINTGTSGDCTLHRQSDGSEICLIYFSDVDIPATSKLFAYGARPLALVAKRPIKINGTLDVSSRFSRPSRFGAGALSNCAFEDMPGGSNSGGGGGAGGSFATQGGAGGIGDIDGTSATGGAPNATTQALSVLRGGCDGQSGATGPGAGGAGGKGGGAIYLNAPVVEVSGAILAGGAGASPGAASRGGGAGGGSGGAIIIQSAAYIVATSALLLATGGGGSSGASGASEVGEGGEDATALTPADGGGASGAGAGGGGNGATNGNGEGGFTNQGGGGGGGGGSGFVILLGTGTNTSTSIMPPQR